MNLKIFFATSTFAIASVAVPALAVFLSREKIRSMDCLLLDYSV